MSAASWIRPYQAGAVSMATYRIEKIAFSIREAAAVSGLSRTTLYALIARRELRGVKSGARRLILRTDLEAYLAGLASQEAQ
jgi:excisionase family DNA binding protein